MREEDKVLLLAEIMGQNTSLYVEKYVEEMRSSEIFLHLCKNVVAARQSNSYKAQRLIDEFESIDFSAISSLRDVFVLEAKIHYLVANSEASDYINPFFYSEEDHIEKVGEIAVDFDQRRVTLNDMILDERYTSHYKIDHIKECYLDWRKELVEKVYDPLRALMIKKENLPKVAPFDSYFIALFLFMVLANVVFMVGPLLPSHFIRSLYLSTCENVFAQYVFYFAFFFMILIDFILILIVSHRIRKERVRFSSMRVLKRANSILADMDRRCEKLYAYILRGIVENKMLEENLSKYCMKKTDLSAIAYLLRSKKEEEVSSTIPGVLRVAFVLFCLLCCILVGFLLYRIGGR